MFELYRHNRGNVLDNYMAIIENPDEPLDGHQPFYDVTITEDGDVMHGEQWSRQEVDRLHERVANGSSVFVKVPASQAPAEILIALAKELEADEKL